MSFYGEITYVSYKNMKIIISCELEDEFMNETLQTLRELDKQYKVRYIQVFENGQSICGFSSAKKDVLPSFERWLDIRICNRQAPILLKAFKKRNIQYETSRNGISFKSKREKRRGVKLAQRYGLTHILQEIN